jgi:hypothetical protein
MNSNKKLNEGIRIAKEGIEECWDDMEGQGMTPEQGEQMSVTISMPGKNISVTTNSADEIGNILRLAGINVGAEPTPAVPAEMPGMQTAPSSEEEPIVFVGAQSMADSGNKQGQESPFTENPGNSGGENNSGGNSGDGDSGEEKTDEATQTPKPWTDSQGKEHPGTAVKGDRYGNQSNSGEEKEEVKEADVDMSGFEFPENGRYGYSERGGNASYGSHGQFNANGLMVIDKETGKVVHHDDFTYFDEEPSQEDLEYWFNEPVTSNEAKKPDADGDGVPDWADKHPGEDDADFKESADILRLAGVTNEAQSAAQKAAFKAMIAKKNGGSNSGKENSGKEKEEEVEESTTETPATNSVVGQGVYEGEDEAVRILALSGIEESKLMNSPAGTSMDEPTVYDKLPSKVGQGAGHKDYGQNRANNQGENPMGMHTSDVDSVEEAFQTAMGEYRKFVSENIQKKK